jgi:UDP-glucose 4-epimerase
MSILVIGGKGLVGIHTSRRFLREGYPVVMYDTYTGDVGDFFDGLPAPIFVEGDISDFEHLKQLVERYQVKGIVHAALSHGAQDSINDPTGSFKAIVEGTLKFLELARLKKDLRLVFISSQAVYGPRPDLKPIKEDDSLNPTDVYPAWKALCDLMCFTYQSVFGVDLVVLRTSFVYGPHRRKRRQLTEIWLRKAIAGESVQMEDGADHEMDMTFAEDMAQGVFLAYKVRPLKHRLFNISQGKNVTFREIAKTIMDLIPGSSIKLGPGPSEYLSKNVVAMRGPADITRAREELGYEPKYTVQKGIGELLDWIRNKEPLLGKE